MVKMTHDTTYRLVEGNWGTKKGVDDVWVVVKLLVDHKGKDTHLSSTAIVQFNTLSAFRGDVWVVGSAVVLKLLLDGSEAKLDSTNGKEGESKTGSWASVKGGKTVLDLVRTKRDTGTSSGDDVTKDGKHGDSSVLGLYSSKSVESLLVGIVKKTKGIPGTRSTCTLKGTCNRISVGHLQGRRSGNLGDRSEGGGADKGGNGKDGSEHYCLVYFKLLVRVN